MNFRHNILKIDTIDLFLNLKGSVNQNQKDVYFVRCLGESKQLGDIIANIDKTMNEKMAFNQLTYIRLHHLPQLTNHQDINFYSGLYNAWKQHLPLTFKSIKQEPALHNAINQACSKIAGIYQSSKESISETMTRNLITKLLFWLDCTMSDTLNNWSERQCFKIIADNIEKEQEFIFYLFLTYFGCDVMLIENRVDVSASPKLLNYSHSFVIGPFGNTMLPAYHPKSDEKPSNKPVASKTNCRKQPNQTVIHSRTVNNHSRPASNRFEKSFEELAQLASSIVLIAIHDKNDEIVGTGSGIMLGSRGFILTNHHVAASGHYYSVRIEEDDKVYRTRELIKYNATTDLAVIRIDRTLHPLQLYDGRKPLVRGQKVVAIGSPLGLFNSVSDGIISGFRKIDDVDMIQFTAPISQGSSGGAVLNMFGEVIGISTAGIDSGQNINLAIGYENIRLFAHGFMT